MHLIIKYDTAPGNNPYLFLSQIKTPSVQIESKGKIPLYKLTEIRSNIKLKQCQWGLRTEINIHPIIHGTSPGVLTYVLSIQETNALLVITTT
jgi:hypothetical protein